MKTKTARVLSILLICFITAPVYADQMKQGEKEGHETHEKTRNIIINCMRTFSAFAHRGGGPMASGSQSLKLGEAGGCELCLPNEISVAFISSGW